MTTHKVLLNKFFAEYAARVNRALAEPPELNIEETAAAFADCFIEASPNGIVCGQNDEKLRAAIPQGMNFYRSIGTKSMLIVSLEVTPLDNLHSMVKVNWKASYIKKDSSKLQIPFSVIYFLQIRNGKPKIFGYITGDERKAYRDSGLIPG